jgi:ankyrin repeat protein
MQTRPYYLLREAAWNGDIRALVANIDLAGKLVDLTDGTALMAAAKRDKPECVRLLLDLECKLNSSYPGQTALLCAGAHGYPDCSRLLLTRQGGMLNYFKDTALSYTLCYSCPGTAECVALHLPREYDVTNPHHNVRNDCRTHENRAIVDAFLRFRHLTADEAAALSDADAKVAFRIVAQCGLVPAVLALAPRCAGTLYYRGRPAITYAICEGQTAVVEALLPFEAGIVDADGWSNLQLACAVANPWIVNLLAPLEIHLLNFDGKTPADYCDDGDSLAAVEDEMLKYAASVAAAGDAEKAKNAFLGCLAFARSDAALALVPHLVDARFTRDRTALMEAARANDAVVVEALLAQAGLVDAQGRSALYHACRSGFPEIVKLLAVLPAELASLHLETRHVTKSPAYIFAKTEDCRDILVRAVFDAPRRREREAAEARRREQEAAEARRREQEAAEARRREIDAAVAAAIAQERATVAAKLQSTIADLQTDDEILWTECARLRENNSQPPAPVIRSTIADTRAGQRQGKKRTAGKKKQK